MQLYLDRWKRKKLGGQDNRDYNEDGDLSYDLDPRDRDATTVKAASSVLWELAEKGISRDLG
jgi:hypothetical protein